MLTFPISNCPWSGLKRQVTILRNTEEVGTAIRLECRVEHLDAEDNVLEKRGIQSFVVPLVADNGTKVNPANGKILEDQQAAGGVGEYSWILGAIEAKAVTPRQVMTAAVAQADELRRFDI